jgi:hypothetical protein
MEPEVTHIDWAEMRPAPTATAAIEQKLTNMGVKRKATRRSISDPGRDIYHDSVTAAGSLQVTMQR